MYPIKSKTERWQNRHLDAQGQLTQSQLWILVLTHITKAFMHASLHASIKRATP